VAPDGLSWLGRGAMLLLAGVAIPFAEEVFFRGVLYKGYHPDCCVKTKMLEMVNMFRERNSQK
jgi:hypothetical protein